MSLRSDDLYKENKQGQEICSGNGGGLAGPLRVVDF